jgi:hypothetical protein
VVVSPVFALIIEVAVVGDGAVVVATAGCTRAVVVVAGGGVIRLCGRGRAIVVVGCALGFGSGGLAVVVVGRGPVFVVVR